MKTEKIILAEIYKENGEIGISFPNEKDVFQFELFGFLYCYLKTLKQNLINQLGEK